MCNKDDLQELVSLASEALGEEDRYLSKCAEQCPATFGDRKPPGIFRIYNERYYQCLILRRLLGSSYRYAVDMEIDGFDLVFYDPAQQISKYAVVGEIKCWRGRSGLAGLPGFRSDFAKMGKSGLTGFELIIEDHPTDPLGIASENQAFLAKSLQLPLENFTRPVSFGTKIYTHGGSPWTAGARVRRRSTESSCRRKCRGASQS